MSNIANEKVKNYWDERANTLGKTAGTNDNNLTEIEHRFLLKTVPKGARIIDLGCGCGGTLIKLAQINACTGIGVDFSSCMVKNASEAIAGENLSDKISVFQHALPAVPLEHGQFDVVITQRSLINLTQGVSYQKEAIMGIKQLLKPGGLYIMIEGSIDGSEAINQIRESLGLHPLNPPWHNLFFREAEVASWQTEDYVIDSLQNISSTYAFMSRILNAQLAAEKGEEINYNSDINRLALRLPPSIGNFGPCKAWLWRRL